jgi:hypothetical protein
VLYCDLSYRFLGFVQATLQSFLLEGVLFKNLTCCDGGNRSGMCETLEVPASNVERWSHTLV